MNRDRNAVACETVNDCKNIFMSSRGFRQRIFAPDDIHHYAVASSPDLYWAKSGPRGASEAQETLANRAAGNVEPQVAFQVRPEKGANDLR